MRIGAIVKSYHFTDYLKPVLKSLKHLDGILIMNYRFPKVPETSDDTKEIVDSLGYKNITLLEGVAEEHQVHNKAMEIFDELKFDWVWINDADEFIQRRDRDAIVSYLSSHPYNGGTTNVIDYTAKDEIAEVRTHRPATIVKSFVRFHDERCADYSNWYFKDIYMHHFGHMVKDKKWKEENLWYNRESYDRVICSKHSHYQMPKEIKELIYE